jgi:hypothetical protein
MTDELKLALFQKALETIDAEIEKTECELASGVYNKLYGLTERLLNQLEMYDKARERIVNRVCRLENEPATSTNFGQWRNPND